MHFFVRQQTHLCLLQQLPSAGRHWVGRQVGTWFNLLRSIMFVCNVPRSKRASFFFDCVILGIFFNDAYSRYVSFLFWFLVGFVSMNISFLSLSLSLLQFCNFCNLLATAESATNWKKDLLQIKWKKKLSPENWIWWWRRTDAQTNNDTLDANPITSKQLLWTPPPTCPLVHLATCGDDPIHSNMITRPMEA